MPIIPAELLLDSSKVIGTVQQAAQVWGVSGGAAPVENSIMLRRTLHF